MDVVDLTGIRRTVDACLEDFLRRKLSAAADHPQPSEAFDAPEALHRFLFAGGKRLRPLLCVVGWHAATSERIHPGVYQAAAALEMFHAFALVHDDVMDRSDTRRGQPTVHRELADRLGAGLDRGEAEHLGLSTAILVGDLALCWSDELLHTAHLPARRLLAVLPVVDVMRDEVMYGQYLDVVSAGKPTGDLATPLEVIRYKTAKYTVERPLHTGAVLAGADSAVLDACTDFAMPLGEAFQLRDDLLGVFGDPARTGKSRLDDLREGKHTVLLALAFRRAGPGQRETLDTLVGDPGLTEDDAARVREVLTATGARDTVEQMIRTRHEHARRALDDAPFRADAVSALRRISDSAEARTS
ncbi:polyprenyl synthetase family protein [Kitasatospora sp. NPDC056783]|uniref:polyprenyl synthetase family protein n=1 Tax=Kitasatospora sp. NPDC056783 TaxID=3345943 RepID=UPI0036A933C8